MAGWIKSGGTKDVRVQRIEEGFAAFATTDNPTASPATINTFDAGKAAGAELLAASGQIYTTGAGGGGQVKAEETNGLPGAW